MQATRYHDMNPKLKINTIVSGSADAPEVVFKFVDDSEVMNDQVTTRMFEYILVSLITGVFLTHVFLLFARAETIRQSIF